LEEVYMKDDNYEKPENESSEEELRFSDGDMEDYPEVEKAFTEGEERPKTTDPPPHTLTSLRRQRRLRRSFILVVLLCLGLGALVLVVFLVMKPEVKKPRIIAKHVPSGQRGDVTTTPAPAEKEKGGEEAFKGRRPEGERPVSSEPTIVIKEEGTRKKVFVLGEQEVRQKEEEVRAAEGEGRSSVSERKSVGEKEEGRRTVAKVEGAKPPAITTPKPPAGRYTVNVGSFREKARAERLMRELDGRGYRAFVAKSTVPKKGTWYRVSVGRYSSREEAEAFARALKEKEGMDSFVREFQE
jgi:cell division septation protein DedD